MLRTRMLCPCPEGLLAVMLCALVAAPAAAQEHSDVLRQEALPTVAAGFTDDPISLDGILDEAAWQTVVPATDFVQSEPREGQPATERTDVRILYDRKQLYFGVYCHDSEPDRLTVKNLARDFNLEEGDVFIVTIDPFDDDRNGFYFATNPAGAKAEGQFFNQGTEVNPHWEGVWHVQARVTADGWQFEIAIPWKTLRFAEKDVQAWGINFERDIKRKNEISTWAPLPRRHDSMYVSLAGHLTGLQGLERGRNLKVKPFTVLDRRESRLPASGPATDGDVGVDLKYGLTPGLTLDLTVNTDFSHVEVDDQQVNLTRFSLFFPEKRDFFLENASIFRLGVGAREGAGRGAARDPRDLMLFFSRRIGLSDSGQPVPILGGARLTGKVDRYRLGVLNVQTRDSSNVAGRNFSVARVRREIFSNSDVGMMFLNRDAGWDGAFSRALGIDGNFRFFQNLTLNSFAARTVSPGVTHGDWASSVSGQWQDRVVNATMVYLNIQENFRNEMGFTPRVGIRHFEPGLGLTFRPPLNATIREFYPHTRIRYITDRAGRLLTTYHHFDWTTRFHGGGEFAVAKNFSSERLDAPFRIHPGVVLPAGDYDWDEITTDISSNSGHALGGSVGYTRGGFWTGTKNSLRVSAWLAPGERFAVTLKYSRDDVRLQQGSFTADVLSTRAQYSFNTHMFLNAFVQYNGASEQMISNFRFNLIHRPLSDIFVVYNETRDRFTNGRLDKAVTLKYTHMLDF